MQWLLSIKYWVISREVPKLLLTDRQIKFNERAYKIISVFGLVVNLIPCFLLSIYRAILTSESAKINSNDSSTVNILYQTINFLLLVSAGLLIDALRRINKTLK